MHDETEEQDDFGATRASDFGATSALPNSRPPGSQAGRPPYSSLGIREQTSHYPRASRADAPMAPRTPTPPAGPATPSPAAAASTRYCGTCGAPLDPGRPFCGQCGTPVSTSDVNGPAMTPSPSGSGLYRGSGAGWSGSQWSESDGDAPTVAELPMDDLYGSYSGRSPVVADDSSRTLRLVVGILCLIGSFATAIAAIILALATFH